MTYAAWLRIIEHFTPLALVELFGLGLIFAAFPELHLRVALGLAWAFSLGVLWPVDA